jgi:hypothetical protein
MHLGSEAVIETLELMKEEMTTIVQTESAEINSLQVK